MLKKFNDILTNPQDNGRYRSTNMLLALIYLGVLIFISILPTSLNVLLASNFEEGTEELLRDEISQIKEDIPNCTVTDGVTSCEEKGSFNVLIYTINLGGDYNKNEINSFFDIYFEEDEVTLYLSNIELNSYSYETLGLSDLDFSLIKNGDKKETEKLYNALDFTYPAVKNIYFVSSLTASALVEIFNIILYTFIVFLIYKESKLTKSSLFKVLIFSSTWYFILTSIGLLFNFSILSLVGLIITITFLRKALEPYKKR